MTISEADFARSDDELLLELAEELVASGTIRLAGPLDDKGKRERARRWLGNVLSELKASICGNPHIAAYLKAPGLQNRVEIAGIVVDCLSAAHIGTPVGTLAVLIVKGRLQVLCG